MDTQIVAVFCLCDDMLKALQHFEDPQSQISDAEVMTTAIVAMLYFGGNMEKARAHMREYGYIPKMLEKVVSIALKVYFFDLAEGSKLTGDKAYIDYMIEDVINYAR